MDNSNKDFGTLEFISLKTNTWNYSHLNDYIRDTVMKPSSSQVTPSPDLSWLNDYIKDIVDESLKGHLNSYTNHQDINYQVPQIAEGTRQCPSDELPCIETLHHNPQDKDPISESSFEEVSEFSAIQVPSADEKTNLPNQTTDYKSQPYTRNIGVQPEIIQTHGMVIIRVNLPDGMNEKDLKISIGNDHAAIKWPSVYMEQLVPLPSDIVRSSANAVIKDNVLEIQIPRIDENNIRAVNIQNLD